jgi:hypothetical protein
MRFGIISQAISTVDGQLRFHQSMLEDKSDGVPGRAKRASAQALLFNPPYLAVKHLPT